ncbi:hypothetical protein ACWD01_25960 [Streptomyces sp. NPDC002835]
MSGTTWATYTPKSYLIVSFQQDHGDVPVADVRGGDRDDQQQTERVGS